MFLTYISTNVSLKFFTRHKLIFTIRDLFSNLVGHILKNITTLLKLNTKFYRIYDWESFPT